MSGMPAARVGDFHLCPMIDGLKPHLGGPVLPPGSPTVLIGGCPGARQGDQCACASPAPDVIARGAMPVPVNNQPAARMTDQTAHGGMIMLGCPTVLIGLAGTSGDPWAGNAACLAARTGRNPPPGAVDNNGNQLQPNTNGQSYNNCGVESSRQLINRANGSTLSQEQMMTQWNQVVNGSNTLPAPGALFGSGGTVPAQRIQLLANNGIPATQVGTVPAGGSAPSIAAVENQLARGQGVHADVWAARLWPPATVTGSGMVPGTATGGHTVTVTGLVYDDNGNITDVVVNDTGIGTCQQTIPVAQFNGSLIGGGNNFVVTSNPVWR
jgi:uncharacterized Zn-binding protein involved in type VI secretion